MKEIRFWGTLLLLTAAVGFMTYQQFHAESVSPQEQAVMPVIQSETVRDSEAPAESFSAAVLTDAEPEMPPAETADEPAEQEENIRCFPSETGTAIQEEQLRIVSRYTEVQEEQLRIVPPHTAEEPAGNDAFLPCFPSEKQTEIQKHLEELSGYSDTIFLLTA